MIAWNIGALPEKDIRRWASYTTAVWLLACVVGWIFEPAIFYRSYLFAWLFWLGVALGSMAFVMLHNLVGGEWGIVRRLGEHAAMTLPLMIVLFIPIALGVRSLFPWARPGAVAEDPLLQHKQPYLNVGFFLLRAAIYLLTWLFIAWSLRANSLEHDRDRDPRRSRRLHDLSAGGMFWYFITMSFATIDWFMSRDPHWYSTIAGFVVITGQALSGLAAVIVLFILMMDMPPFRELARREQLNDLGNLLLTTVILWAYMSFVQFLVIWMGNKQDEIPWYVRRLSNGWLAIGAVLVVFHFFVPFIVLLMRELKRTVPAMLGLCGGLLILRALDVFWQIAPPSDQSRPLLLHTLSWMDFVFPLGMGGAWLAMFLWLMAGHPLVPQGNSLPVTEAHGTVP